MKSIPGSELPIPPPDSDYTRIESTVANWTVGIPLRYSEVFESWVDHSYRLSIKPNEHWRDAFARAITQKGDLHKDSNDPNFYCFFIDR